jgi:hypothetical protein
VRPAFAAQLDFARPARRGVCNHLVIQFLHSPIEKSCAEIPELGNVLPLLDRARHGIEFFGFSERAVELWGKVKAAKGLFRLAAFLELMAVMSKWTDYRLLSSVQMRGESNSAELEQINYHRQPDQQQSQEVDVGDRTWRRNSG